MENVSSPGAGWRVAFDSGPGNWDWNRVKAVAGDFNGDGKDDVGAFYNYDGSLTRLWVTENVGSPTATWRLAFDSGPGNWDWNRVTAVTGDFNGDGNDDVGSVYDYGNAQLKLWLSTDVGSAAGANWRVVWDSGVGNWDGRRADWLRS